jgi:valyl-tRNA synthetase
MPFVSEAIWEQLNASAPARGIEQPFPAAEMLVHARWPVACAAWEEQP